MRCYELGARGSRSDVYAAGCVLYVLLAGEPPFTGDTPVAVTYQSAAQMRTDLVRVRSGQQRSCASLHHYT